MLAAVVVAALGVTAFAWTVVNRPHVDAPPSPSDPVDALIVLGPLDAWRLPLAEQYMKEGRAKNLVLSTPNMPWDAMYCDRPHDWTSYCFPPDPSTTRGEAMGLQKLAAEHGWKTFAVLTVDFHVERSRFIFERCLRQDVTVLGGGSPSTASRNFQMLHQMAGYAKELAKGPCPQ